MKIARTLVAAWIVAAGGAAMGACGGGGDGGGDPPAGDASPPGTDAAADGPAPTEGGRDGGGGDADGSTDAQADADGGADAEGPPSVRFVGRFDTSDPAVAKVAWPGARILARFSGTQASAKLQGVMGYSGLDLWDVTVDGALTKTITLTTTMTTYDLTGVLPAGVHTVELFKRTEAFVGTTWFGGFDFGTGQLLSPPTVPTRRIEFLGDSSSNGYGIESPTPTSCTNGPTIQNDHKAWPWLVAQALSADHHNLAYGGRGVFWNYTRSFADTFKVIYPRTFPDLLGSTWSFASFVPDVVWITLGGNDYDMPNPGDPPPAYSDFKTAYTSLVAQIRAAHANALIVLAVPTSLNDDYPPGYNARTNVTNATTQIAAESGDPKIVSFAFTPAVFPGDLTACNYHPNVAKHAAMAAEAASFLKTKMGW